MSCSSTVLSVNSTDKSRERAVRTGGMPAFKAVIFDLDGALIDSNWLHLRSWQISARRLELDIPDQEIMDRLGLKTADIARQVVPGRGEETVRKLVELKSGLFEEAWRREVRL